jgi:hypothetical protein
MRIASLAIFGLLLLTSCKKPSPDFTFIEKSPDGSRLATIRGFQPRGTIEGYILISFNRANDDGPSASFRQIENGQAGWISDDTFVVVADQARFSSLSSEYYPNGTTDSKVRLVVCTQNDMDCSGLLKHLGQSSETQKIVHFPES